MSRDAVILDATKPLVTVSCHKCGGDISIQTPILGHEKCLALYEVCLPTDEEVIQAGAEEYDLASRSQLAVVFQTGYNIVDS